MEVGGCPSYPGGLGSWEDAGGLGSWGEVDYDVVEKESLLLGMS